MEDAVGQLEGGSEEVIILFSEVIFPESLILT
jgi:hypothetical protein